MTNATMGYRVEIEVIECNRVVAMETKLKIIAESRFALFSSLKQEHVESYAYLLEFLADVDD